MKVENTYFGVLRKSNGAWGVEYKTEKRGDNTWFTWLPIYGQSANETIADLDLVQLFNKPVIELHGMSVQWKYFINESVTDFASEYAILI